MAVFPANKYNFNSLYILNNGWYIDFDIKDGKNTPIIKTPEGAEWRRGESTRTVPAKPVVDGIISELSTELNEDSLSLQEIIEKKSPPVKKSVNQFEIIGKVLNDDGDPIKRASVKATLIEFPPPPPSLPEAGGADPQQYTDFENTYFELGAAVTIPDVQVNDAGEFTIEYLDASSIDFSKSYILIQADDYFPKTIGPTLVKTGQRTLTRSSTSKEFQGSTSQIDSKLFEQEDGSYRAEITLKNNDTEQIVTGEGISVNREVAKKIARGKALKQFTAVDTTTDTVVIDVYDVGRINLTPIKLDLEEEEAKLLIQVQEAENIAANIKAKSQLPFEVIIANIFNTLKENIKRVLFPAIMAIVAKFGATLVHNFINKKFQPPDDFSCPSREVVLEAIRKRNLLVKQLNNIYKIVRTITKVLNITNALILGFKIGINIAKAIPSPPFSPTNLFASGLAGIEKKLEVAGIVVNILTILATAIGIALGVAIQWLNSLDFVIQECAEEEDISFEEINREINSFIDPTTGKTEDIINPLTNKPFPYKGFTFEIKDDITQSFKYPKRYAIARNVQGIQVLRSESSFASNPEILIEELKFVIDRDNLRAD